MLRRSERVQFGNSRGYQLAGIVDRPEGDHLGVILFTHCFTCSKDLKAIVRISRLLAEHGFIVLRYDQTGLGGSEGDFSQSNFSTNRDDLQSAVDFISAHYAAPDFLIGHSFGGACSLSLAQSIDSVAGVIALAAPSDTSHLATLLERMNPDISVAGRGTVRIGGFEFEITSSMLDDFRSFDLSVELRKLNKSVLLMHSPTDETLAYDHAIRLFQMLSQRGTDDGAASEVSLITLPNCDHLFLKDARDLAYVANLATAWCKRHLHRSDKT